MNSCSRRWLRSGLALGALVGAAYCWQRARAEPAGTETSDDPITERHGAAFLVRRRLDPERLEGAFEDVREAVDRRDTDPDDDPLLGLEGATTTSLFLDWNGDEPELVWYVEMPRAVLNEWDGDDPAATVADAFPVDHEAIHGGASCSDEPVERELLVHAVHPSRPRTTVAAEADRAERSDEDTDGADRTVDVDLVRMDLESGFPARFADWFAGLSRRVTDGELELRPIESWSVAMLEAEDMFSESVFLERRPDGYSLVGYMETAEMEGVYDAYYDTWNPVARLSEIVLGRILVDPSVILEYPLETNVELLAHATHPERPRDAAERRQLIDEQLTS